MRIMVADQDSEHRRQIIEWMQKWGHVVQEALSAREVVEQCRKKCPDLVLIDFLLSGQSGVETVRQIRQTGGHAVWVPIVVMAKEFSNQALMQVVDAGADDILSKPLDEIRLMIKVQSAARQVNLKEEVFKVAHELVVVNRALQNVVTLDVLTGISNSHSFEEALERECSIAQKNHTPVSLILLNIDFFQAYNQVYGAELGDQAIKKIADALKKTLSDTNAFLARAIGDTFAILLPNTGRDEAYKIGGLLHQAVEGLNILHRSSGCGDHITASFGVATTKSDQVMKAAELKDAADYGLYQAKHYGRNRGFLVPAAEMVK
jgi:diguanylate cyclase (GGDEF)-like protein